MDTSYFSIPSRYRQHTNGLQWGWPGFYLECQVHGSEVCIELDAPNRRIALYDNNSLLCELASNIGKAAPIRLSNCNTHLLRLQDLSDEWHSIASLRKFKCMPGTHWLPAPAPRPKLFEFIGDSWTSGWGNLSATEHVSDCTQAYAALCASMCNADYSLVAAAGQGIVKNFGDTPPSELTLVQQSSRTIPTLDVPWTAVRPADHVFLLAGENDHSFEPWPSASLFSNGVCEILRKAQLRSPHAQLTIVNIERAHVNPARIRNAHRQALETGLKVNLLELPALDESKPWGYCYHPGLAHHRKLAHDLANYLEHLS